MEHNKVTVVLPTYEEFDSLPSLIDALQVLRSDNLPSLQLIIVDDNSNDGTEKLISDMNHDWVQLIVRTKDRGLSSAVIDGLKKANSTICVVMDADGSHPANSIPPSSTASRNPYTTLLAFSVGVCTSVPVTNNNIATISSAMPIFIRVINCSRSPTHSNANPSVPTEIDVSQGCSKINRKS